MQTRKLTHVFYKIGKIRRVVSIGLYFEKVVKKFSVFY